MKVETKSCFSVKMSRQNGLSDPVYYIFADSFGEAAMIAQAQKPLQAVIVVERLGPAWSATN